jgi:hypothetical protein
VEKYHLYYWPVALSLENDLFADTQVGLRYDFKGYSLQVVALAKQPQKDIGLSCPKINVWDFWAQ